MGGGSGLDEFQRRGRVGAWLAVPKRGKSREGLACLAVPQEGARARGVGFGSGRVGVLFFEKEEKWRFLKDALVEWAGYPPELAWPITLELPKRVDGGVDQGPWLGWVGRRGWMAIQGLRFRKGRCVIFRKLEGS